jgi:hypothetical protein
MCPDISHEIKNILENIGFKFVAAYGSLDKEPLTIDTRLMRLAGVVVRN